MKKRIIAYKNRIDACLSGEIEVDDWEALLKEHLTQIAFFQHERLIHLLVTILFAAAAIAVMLVTVVTAYLPLTAVFALLLILLVPYIKHYYLLENKTQEMYEQYDEILKKIRPAGKKDENRENLQKICRGIRLLP